MARRIEVELTSAREDGTWTWRAAGAKQPRGVIDGALLSDEARVGDVLRAEAEFEIDGIFITSVLPAKEKKRAEPQRLEILGPPREQQGVTSSLVAKPAGTRGGRPPRAKGQAPERRTGREPASGPDRASRPPPRRVEREGPREGPPDRRERAPRTARGGRAERTAAQDRRREPTAEAAPTPAPPKPKRLSPANVHRAAVLASMAPEERPIAEQVLRGGIPAVRQAVAQQNAQLREQGQPEVKAEPLVAMAEQLLPQLKAAEWRDRAEAAAKDVDEIALRDLRSVVAGADAARDDETRLLAGKLRDALERRIEAQRERWTSEIAAALDEGRLVRALRLSARPPDPGSRFPAELALRLGQAAGEAMSPDVTPERWATLLDAVAASPVRRSVKPAGLPAEADQEVLQAARQAAGRIPALATLLGIDMPPPPGPARPRSATARSPRPRPARSPARPERPSPGTGEGPPAGSPPPLPAPAAPQATAEPVPAPAGDTELA